MIKHNLKLVMRYLWTKKIYTSTILLSLTVGFVCSNLLISFLIAETNTDTFHKNQNRIVQLFSNDPFSGTGRIAYIPAYFYDYLTSNFAEVENVCQFSNIDGVTLGNEKNKLPDLMLLSVDSSFFTFFDFPHVQKNENSCFGPQSIVLSDEKAKQLFGSSDVIGEVVTVSSSDTAFQLVVSAVMTEPIGNSHLKFDALVHHSVLPKKWNGGASYILLSDEGVSSVLQRKINSDSQRPGLLGPGKVDYFLEPLADSYFSAANKAQFMKTRSPLFIKVGYVVCGLIVFIVLFNFINLFLLFWHSRKREVGIKKTLGITSTGLFSFSLTETSVYVFLAFGLSVIATALLVPTFNAIFEASLSSAYFLNVKVISMLALIVFLSGALVVAVSIVKQWGMKPVSLMSKDSSKVRFSRVLFTIQFVISITLAVCAVTIIQQMRFIENAPLGFNRNIIQLNAPDRNALPALSALKQKIMLLPDVNHVTVCSGNPISGNIVIRYDLKDGEFYTPYLFEGDEDFFKTLDLKLIEGRLPGASNSGKLVNQKLVSQFNLRNPVGERVPGTDDVISGVVEDFTCSSFKQEVPPVIISYKSEGQVLLIGYQGNTFSTLLPQIEMQWKNVFPDNLFTYRVIQRDLMKKYKEETFFYRILIVFSGISMVLSCFGLFALSWAVIQNRTKEMGIRKVLGATSIDILNLLTLTFTKRIAVAFIVAAPVGYYLMDRWLARFANRIELSAWIFVLSALIVVVVAFVTLSLQTVKAIMTNPVDEIRNE